MGLIFPLMKANRFWFLVSRAAEKQWYAVHCSVLRTDIILMYQDRYFLREKILCRRMQRNKENFTEVILLLSPKIQWHPLILPANLEISSRKHIEFITKAVSKPLKMLFLKLCIGLAWNNAKRYGQVILICFQVECCKEQRWLQQS